MSFYETERKCRMYSNETLRELARSKSKKLGHLASAARTELARRDFVAIFEFNPTHGELVQYRALALAD